MSRVLTLVTSGIQEQTQGTTEHPRTEFMEIQRLIETDLVSYEIYKQTPLGGLFRKLETAVSSDLYLTLVGLLRKRKYDAVFSMSERVGIPFSALNRLLPERKPLIARFSCWSNRQEQFIKRFNLLDQMDTIIVDCNSMKNHLMGLGVPESRIHMLLFAQDDKYFTPLPDIDPEPGRILTLGEIRSRNYKVLFEAVNGLPVTLDVLAAGSWYAREKNTVVTAEIPENVTLRPRVNRHDLKEMYARSQFVVLPVYDELYSAGSTGTLEAMGMGRPVIATRSRGLVDYIVHGETGLLVEPGDVQAMREAIQYLLENPEEARRMGENARQRITEELNLDRYARSISDVIESQI